MNPSGLPAQTLHLHTFKRNLDVLNQNLKLNRFNDPLYQTLTQGLVSWGLHGAKQYTMFYSFACKDSLGPHQVLVFEGGSLQVDDPLGPQGDLEDTANLNVYLGWTQDHHVVVLQNEVLKFVY